MSLAMVAPTEGRDETCEVRCGLCQIKPVDYGALLAIRHYNQPPAENSFIVAVYREISESDGFLVTGDGLVFRYDEATGKLVGVTIVGVRARLVSGSAGQ